jgi:tetratricopeptide (TPR) repeat protein
MSRNKSMAAPTPRTQVRRLSRALDDVRDETLDYADGFAAFDALKALPTAIHRERDPYRRIAFRARLANCAFMTGEYELARYEARVALRAIDRLTHLPNEPAAWLHHTLGVSASRQGDSAIAVEHLQRAATLHARFHNAESEAEVLSDLAEALIDLDDDEAALTVLERCLPRLRGPWARDAAEQMARLAKRRGDLDRRIDALAVAREQGLGSGSEDYDHIDALTDATLVLVEALLERNRPADRRRARSLLEDSLRRLRQYTSKPDADELRRQLDQL